MGCKEGGLWEQGAHSPLHIHASSRSAQVSIDKAMPRNLEGCLVAWNLSNVSDLSNPTVPVQLYHL